MDVKAFLALVLAVLVAVPTGAVLVFGVDTVAGRTDRVIEETASILPVPRVTLPADVRDGEVAHTFTWTYSGIPYAWTVSVPEDAVHDYETRPRTLDPRTYGLYVTDPAEDALVARLADGLGAAADERGYDDVARANFILAFVQGLPYVADETSAGMEDYPRYPAQTVGGNHGDCEDAGILYVSIMRALGFDATLLLMPGHMAAGVSHPDVPGPRFDDYAFAEVSVAGYRVGEVPREFFGTTIRALDLSPQPALQLAWTATPEEGGWTVRLDVWNNGTLPARDVHVHAGMVTPQGDENGARARLHTLPPGAHATRWVWVPDAGDADTHLRAVAWGEDAPAVGGDLPVASIGAREPPPTG